MKPLLIIKREIDVQAAPNSVNWAPWSLLNIKGLEQLSAPSRADRQKNTSNEFESSHDNTYQEYQSKIATR